MPRKVTRPSISSAGSTYRWSPSGSSTIGNDGRLITESLRDYTKHTVEAQYTSLDDFLRRWSAAERKETVVEELGSRASFWKHCATMSASTYDAFDLVCHVVYDRPAAHPPRSAQKRFASVTSSRGMRSAARAVLDALLDKYAEALWSTCSDLGDTPRSALVRLGNTPRTGSSVRRTRELLGGGPAP